MDANPIRILLEVEVIDDSLTGRASAGDGTTRDFAGWLGLLNVLERLLPGSRSPIDAQERSAPIVTDGRSSGASR